MDGWVDVNKPMRDAYEKGMIDEYRSSHDDFPSITKNNTEAMETIINYAMENDIPYFAGNLPNDTCLDCEYTNVNIPDINVIKAKKLEAELQKNISNEDFLKKLKIKIMKIASEQINKDADKGYTTVGFCNSDGHFEQNEHDLDNKHNDIDILPVWEECKSDLQNAGYNVKVKSNRYNYCYLYIEW